MKVSISKRRMWKFFVDSTCDSGRAGLHYVFNFSALSVQSGPKNWHNLFLRFNFVRY